MNPEKILISQLRDIARGFIELLPQLAAAVLIVILTALAVWLVKGAVARAVGRRLRPSLKTLFVNLGGIATWLVGLMVAAVVVFPTLTPAKMLAGLGLGSVAIGFAFKDVFENFVAGVIILFRREMRIGDVIHCESIEGRVEQISVRDTHVRQLDDQLVIVPNAMLFKNPLRILTDRDLRRVSISCGVAYREDVDAAREVIREAVEGCESVRRQDRPVQVFAEAFGASSIDFELTWWTGSEPGEVRRSRDEVIAAVKRALDAAGIEIPFPYRTLTFAEPLPVASAPAPD